MLVYLSDFCKVEADEYAALSSSDRDQQHMWVKAWVLQAGQTNTWADGECFDTSWSQFENTR